MSVFRPPKLVLCSLIPNQIVINSHPIAKSLIHWYSGAKRDLPWRKTRDPYIIWISEIILQQTRVDQGLPYFERFIDSFPDVHSLARASEDTVLTNWQGLGYYSRARNLHATARDIVGNLEGNFPRTYEQLIELKGVGPYTAAAISSICFNEAEPVVDGNVYRVASRLFGIRNDISKSGTHKVFAETLRKIIPSNLPGEFNQAMMELGATVCKPSPSCHLCILQQHCYAFEKGETLEFPIKKKKIKVTNRNLIYLVLEKNGLLLMKKRTEKDIWKGLYDFPLSGDMKVKVGDSIPRMTGPIIHLLSHQKLSVYFLRFSDMTEDEFDRLERKHNCKAFSMKHTLTLPKPKIIIDYLRQLAG